MLNHPHRRPFTIALSVAALGACAGTSAAQTMAAVGTHGQLAPCTRDSVVAIAAPRTPLPSPAETKGLTRFSFIAYGDTRGRHDGQQLQSEHQLVIESMLATIKAAAGGPDAIRFVLQSGDASGSAASPRSGTSAIRP